MTSQVRTVNQQSRRCWGFISQQRRYVAAEGQALSSWHRCTATTDEPRHRAVSLGPNIPYQQICSVQPGECRCGPESGMLWEAGPAALTSCSTRLRQQEQQAGGERGGPPREAAGGRHAGHRQPVQPQGASRCPHPYSTVGHRPAHCRLSHGLTGHQHLCHAGPAHSI